MSSSRSATDWREVAARVALLLVLSVLPQVPAAAAGPDIDYRHSLLIMWREIVAPQLDHQHQCQIDPALPDWSFASLMGSVGGSPDDASTAKFIRDWLALFDQRQTLPNGLYAVERPQVAAQIAKPWADDWNYDPAHAPFRLLAIVNRMDLRVSPLLIGENAGEIHFVFGAIDVTKGKDCAPLPMTVILEFGVRVPSPDALKQMAGDWIDLSGYDPGGQMYRDKLARLLHRTIAPNVRPGAKPNGSAIDHIRTNEALGGQNWEMREFQLAAGTGADLVEANMTLTPTSSLIGTPQLALFLASIGHDIALQDYWVPLYFPGASTALLGSVALPRGLANSPPVSGPHPSDFSFNTCTGCHGGDATTNTGKFTHIDPTLPWYETYSRASSFLHDQVTDARCLQLLALSGRKGTDGCTTQPGARVRRPLVH